MAFETPFSSAAAPEPAVAPLPLCQERPAPGTFMFLPTGAPWKSSSLSPGDPTGHPVLVLPATDDDPEKVQILFTTTKDIMGNYKARRWGENYLPLGNQEHPWREPVALCGSFPRPTSLNVTSKYNVPWRCLEDLAVNGSGVPAPCLSSQGLEKVREFVESPHSDYTTPKLRAPVASAKCETSVPYTLRSTPGQKGSRALSSPNWRRQN
ncbi:hypothetical protein KCU65_g1368, partial [Aureobasidium melanogenum]